MSDHDGKFGFINGEPIDDATALALRDAIVQAMIADACQWMPPIRLLCLAGGSPLAHMRAMPMGDAQAKSILLRAGIELGVLDPLGAGRVRPEGRA